MEELQEAADEFLQKRDQIYQLIHEFDLVSVGSRKLMIKFLDEFFDMLTKPNKMKSEFIQKS